jgi:ubiquinone/menaquinone biosynthesis C-methylase UbiE
MAETWWDDKADYLSASRPMYHNEDYWRFLVRDVWGVDKRPCSIVDFGCGAGWIGLFLMPMLGPGSDYTGIDRSAPLLERGRAAFAPLPYRAEFIQADADATSFADSQFDLAIAHALMMHLPEPAKGLAEMIRVTRDGGRVITCDASHNAFNALLHIEETEEQDRMPLSMFQAINANIRRRGDGDHSLGMKMPVLMHRAGLLDVQARISDAVRLSFPPLDTPEKERIFKALCDDGLGGYPTDDESFSRILAWFIARGAPEDVAAAELRREMENDFRRAGRDYHTVQPGLMTISYGTVSKAVR